MYVHRDLLWQTGNRPVKSHPHHLDTHAWAEQTPTGSSQDHTYKRGELEDKNLV